MYVLLTKCVVKMAAYWLHWIYSCFASLQSKTRSRNTKESTKYARNDPHAFALRNYSEA